MFAPTAQQIEEDYFANINNSKSIECIIPTSEILINFRVNGVRAKKPCYVYAERMDFKGLIQLRLTEKCDQRRMYITTVDSSSFNELKQEQSLHVTFGGFIENLVHILQDCQAGKLEISLVQLQQHAARLDASMPQAAGADYQLQFVEMRSFKNLVHLCLPCRMAPLNVVLFYMNSILDAMQKKICSQEQVAQQLQMEVHTHVRRVEQLEADKAKTRDGHAESTHMLKQRHAEELQQMQEAMRKCSEQRQADSERSRKTASSMQTQLEKLAAEKASLQAEKVQEQKRNEVLNEELASSRAHASCLKEQNEKYHSELAALRNLERKNDMHLSDARKHVAELQDKLKKFDKAKADIIAELEAEKKISQTKRQALEMATEEISKANEIILKQTQELLKMRKTIGWRTEVALQQEKAVNERDQLLKLRDEEITHLRLTVEDLRREIPKQLESMRTFANSLEEKYSEQISALKQKLKPVGKENAPMPINGLAPNRRK